jgi:hypothetical protein
MSDYNNSYKHYNKLKIMKIPTKINYDRFIDEFSYELSSQHKDVCFFLLGSYIDGIVIMEEVILMEESFLIQELLHLRQRY